MSSYSSLSLSFPHLKSQDEARGVLWYTPEMPALGRQRQEDLSQVSLGCVRTYCINLPSEAAVMCYLW